MDGWMDDALLVEAAAAPLRPFLAAGGAELWT